MNEQRIRHLIEQGGYYPYPRCNPRRTERIAWCALLISATALVIALL